MAEHRKDGEEKIFESSWTDLDYFVEQIEKPICLICTESFGVNKEYNQKCQKGFLDCASKI